MSGRSGDIDYRVHHDLGLCKREYVIICSKGPSHQVHVYWCIDHAHVQKQQGCTYQQATWIVSWHYRNAWWPMSTGGWLQMGVFFKLIWNDWLRLLISGPWIWGHRYGRVFGLHVWDVPWNHLKLPANNYNFCDDSIASHRLLHPSLMVNYIIQANNYMR